MKRKKKSMGVRITQILAIIVLVLAVISSAFYFVVSSSLEQAAANETVPEFAGKLYLPMETNNQESIASQGDLILGEEAQADQLQASQTVIYESPSLSTVNQVYGNYSIGVINSVNEENGETVLHVQTADGEIEAVSSTLVIGEATYSIAALGSLVMAVNSQMGLFEFVVLPAGIFVVLQLLSVIFRVFAGSRAAEDEDDEDEDEEDYDYDYDYEQDEEQEEEYEYEEEEPQEEQSSSVKRVQRFIDTPPRITQIRSETVSSLDGEFNGFHNEVLRPFRASAQDQADEDGPMDPVSAAGEQEEGPKTPLVPGSFGSPADQVISDQEYHGVIPFADPSQAKSKGPAQVTYLDANDSDREKERREMMQRTMEFDMKAIRERMKKNPPQKKRVERTARPAEKTDPQQILDKIMIEVKDRAVDFNFQDLKEDHVKVKRSEKGDGFVIQTPQYRASIKVEIDDSADSQSKDS